MADLSEDHLILIWIGLLIFNGLNCQWVRACNYVGTKYKGFWNWQFVLIACASGIGSIYVALARPDPVYVIAWVSGGILVISLFIAALIRSEINESKRPST